MRYFKQPITQKTKAIEAHPICAENNAKIAAFIHQKRRQYAPFNLRNPPKLFA